jgi:hypothetical protein
MKKMYKFFWDYGRMGEVEGIFVADEETVKNAIGKNIYFGEILGKHSEVYGNLTEKDLTVVTDDQDFIEKAILYGIDSSGYNPLSYLPEEN